MDRGFYPLVFIEKGKLSLLPSLLIAAAPFSVKSKCSYSTFRYHCARIIISVNYDADIVAIRPCSLMHFSCHNAR